MPTQHWARNFSVNGDDLEFLTGQLLEKERPLTTEELARILIDERLNQELARLQDRYKGALAYNPSQSFKIGQKLVFPVFDHAIGNVVAARSGANPRHGAFNVIAVEFEDTEHSTRDTAREFAVDLTTGHKLSDGAGNGEQLFVDDRPDADEILHAAYDAITTALETGLRESGDLVQLAGAWFPRSLLLDVNEGHLNLAEAVLDLAAGGPLSTQLILEEIGGLGDAPRELQTFSMNYALNEDKRFDEVGPAGEVRWFLARLEPPEVRRTPNALRYTPVPYDRGFLTPALRALEAEIADELSPVEDNMTLPDEAVITLIYPHRRLGTLPLNSRLRPLFPTARRTTRIWIRIVDGQDGETYPAWVVPEGRYVFGLEKFYRKHRLPIGAHVRVTKGDSPGEIVVDFQAYRARTEWIRLIMPIKNRPHFENKKRSIGAEYDDLMIIGADDLEAVDELAEAFRQKPLAALLRELIPELGRLTPQGTVHARTLYSAVNVMRRCPPGAILATLVANPDFEDVGGHYWKLQQE